MNPPATGEQLTDEIRRHYDAQSGFYHLLWGPHIHHGYWQDDETPTAAQVKLIERLAARANYWDISCVSPFTKRCIASGHPYMVVE